MIPCTLSVLLGKTPHLLVVVAILAFGMSASAQTGTTYRFRDPRGSGQVWVLGDSARMEVDGGTAGAPVTHARVLISKHGGRQLLVLDKVDRTYYDDSAYRKRTPAVIDGILATLTAGRPFRVEGVENLKFDLSRASQLETASGYRCQRATLTFSYELKLSLERPAGVRMPGRVQGTASFCMSDAAPNLKLPFGHGAELQSGIPAVDAAAGEQLKALSGIPVAMMLVATRRIENGDGVTARTGFVLSDIHPAEIAPDRFEVPKNYRYREPVVTAPTRR